MADRDRGGRSGQGPLSGLRFNAVPKDVVGVERLVVSLVADQGPVGQLLFCVPN